MYPKLGFSLDVQEIIDYDFEMYKGFLLDRQFDNGKHFKMAVLEPHDLLKQYFTGTDIDLPDSAIKDYIRDTHLKRNINLLSIVFSYQESWEKVSAQYFLFVNKLFPLYDWPIGMYMGYPTIWGMYPRKIETCTFSFPVDHKNINTIIAHEFLHFMFYDYAAKYFSEYMDLNSGIFIWDVSEIFNVLLQNSQKCLNVFQEKVPGYDEHKEIIAKLSQNKIVIQHSDVNAIISLIIDEVKNQI